MSSGCALHGRPSGAAPLALVSLLALLRAAPDAAVLPSGGAPRATAAGRPRRAAALLPIVACPLAGLGAGGAALAEEADPAAKPVERYQPATWIPEVGDQMRVKPGVEFKDKDGEDVYEPGDYGYIRKVYAQDGKKRLEILWPRTKKLSTISVDKWSQLYVGIVETDVTRVRRPAEGAKPRYSFDVPPGFQVKFEVNANTGVYGRKDGGKITVVPIGREKEPSLSALRDEGKDITELIKAGVATFGTRSGFKTAILDVKLGDKEDYMETTEALTPDDGFTPSWVRKQMHRWLRAVKTPTGGALMIIELPEEQVKIEQPMMKAVLGSLRLES